MPIDLAKIKAIDVHVHAEVSCHDPEDPAMGQYFDAASAYFKASRSKPITHPPFLSRPAELAAALIDAIPLDHA